jgi:DNA-binding SARP family transcriptional activator
MAPPVGPLTFGVLGPLEVRRDGVEVKAGGQKARSVLALLVLNANRVVPASQLIEGVWGEDAPDGAGATLQVHVSNLRKALGAEAVETRAPGYLLPAQPDQVDLLGFEADLAAARAAQAAGNPAQAAARYRTALARWRGSALADVLDAPFTSSAVPWLAERRTLALEELAEVRLALGEHRDAVADLEAAVAEFPHRERLWGQLMVALYRSGRQADALAAYQRARRVLADDLGIDPGAELRRLEAAVLAQDPSLDPPAAPAPPAAPEPGGPLVEGPDPTTTFRAFVQRNCRLELPDGRLVPLTAAASIGRHPGCEVHLADGSVSRRHVELRPALGGYLLVDLGSTNGTLVNGTPTVHHLLRDGDEITLGTFTLRYRSESAADA